MMLATAVPLPDHVDQWSAAALGGHEVPVLEATREVEVPVAVKVRVRRVDTRIDHSPHNPPSGRSE